MDSIFYTAQALREATPQELIDVLNTDDRVVWADLEQPTEADLAKLREVFGFHPLALEDSLSSSG